MRSTWPLIRYRKSTPFHPRMVVAAWLTANASVTAAASSQRLKRKQPPYVSSDDVKARTLWLQPGSMGTPNRLWKSSNRMVRRPCLKVAKAKVIPEDQR